MSSHPFWNLMDFEVLSRIYIKLSALLIWNAKNAISSIEDLLSVTFSFLVREFYIALCIEYSFMKQLAWLSDISILHKQHVMTWCHIRPQVGPMGVCVCLAFDLGWRLKVDKQIKANEIKLCFRAFYWNILKKRKQ